MVLNEIKPWATPNFVDTTYIDALLNEDHYEKDVEFVCWPLIQKDCNCNFSSQIKFVEDLQQIYPFLCQWCSGIRNSIPKMF